MASSDSEEDIDIEKAVETLFKRVMNLRELNKGEDEFIRFLKTEKAKEEQSAKKSMSREDYVCLSNSYIESFVTTTPDRGPKYNSIFKGWLDIMRAGHAIGHVMIEQYGLAAMEHLDLRYVNACQQSLEFLCDSSSVPIRTFCVPTEYAIQHVVDNYPSIIALDEGAGYLADTLSCAGAKVILGNIKSRTSYFTSFPAQQKTTYELLKTNRYHNMTLLICPGIRSSIARHINLYKGDTVIYFGERNVNTDIDHYLKAHSKTWTERHRIELPIVWHTDGAYLQWVCIFERQHQ